MRRLRSPVALGRGETRGNPFITRHCPSSVFVQAAFLTAIPTGLALVIVQGSGSELFCFCLRALHPCRRSASPKPYSFESQAGLFSANVPEIVSAILLAAIAALGMALIWNHATTKKLVRFDLRHPCLGLPRSF